MPGGGEYDSSLLSLEIFFPLLLHQNVESQPVWALSTMNVFLFHTIFTINRRNVLKFISSLMKTYVVRMTSSAIVLGAPYFLIIEICLLRLLLIAVLVRMTVSFMMVRVLFPLPFLHIT